jgi:hypothetical protein
MRFFFRLQGINKNMFSSVRMPAILLRFKVSIREKADVAGDIKDSELLGRVEIQEDLYIHEQLKVVKISLIDKIDNSVYLLSL